MATGQTVKLPTVNKQIIEIKKRIQLSEGQRKALFEDIESNRKKSTEEIVTLKKDISKLVVTQYEIRTNALRMQMPIIELQKVIGHVGDKSAQEILKVFDLFIIDKNKKLDIIKYKTKNKEELLTKLAQNYQELLAKKIANVALVKKQNLTAKTILELRNKINAAEVQWREAEHVRARYKEIKRTLLDDAAHFENRVRQISDEIIAQHAEMEKLQKVNLEACKLRGEARSALVREEKLVMTSGHSREKQATEGKRLVQERKQELEYLEKTFYQSNKKETRADLDEDSPKEANSPCPSSDDPMQTLVDTFEVLKEATGGTGIKEVYEKFMAQRETQNRLSELRTNSESVKIKLEKSQEKYVNDLEQLKFVETKDSEQNAEALDKLNQQIVEQKSHKVETRLKMDNIAQVNKDILQRLQSIYVTFNKEDIEDDPIEILNFLNKLLEKARKEQEERERANTLEFGEDKWLPVPYADILRRTPVPQHGSPTPAPPIQVSEDEEEVPSRGYLKRQAQLVVDAKLKRKNMRFPVGKK